MSQNIDLERKNGVYIASVQKDYNHGYENSLNLHALGKFLIFDEFNLPAGTVIDNHSKAII